MLSTFNIFFKNDSSLQNEKILDFRQNRYFLCFKYCEKPLPHIVCLTDLNRVSKNQIGYFLKQTYYFFFGRSNFKTTYISVYCFF